MLRMAELIHTSVEDDDSDDKEGKGAPKRIDPKKLVNVPFVKPPETDKPATAEDLKRTVEFIPPIFGEARARILPEAEKTEEDDEDDDEESKEAAAESPATAEEATETVGAAAPPESEEAIPPSPAEMQELAEEEMAHLREESRAPAQEAARVEAVAEEPEAEEPPAAPSGGAAAPPPPPPPAESGFFGGSEPAPRPVFQSAFETPQESRPAPAFSSERPLEMRDLDRRTEEERSRNLRLVVVAGVATGILIKSYIDAKTKSYKEILEPLKDMAVDLLANQKRTDAKVEKVQQKVERIAPPVATESLPPIQQPQEQIFDMEGNPITLQPGWRVERSAGGYSVVLDRHNRVIYDAIQYGEAFKRDQKREQLDPDVYGTVDQPSAGAPPANDFAAGQPDLVSYTPKLTPESTTPEEYKHPVGYQSDGPSPRRNLFSGVSLPWLLTAIAVLLIVYFIAALA